MAKKSSVTPVRKQYLDIKKQFPDAIVFFRLGDFYETFDADAELAARELDIVLTSRNVAKDQRIPMAGVPYHAVESYIARLIEKGYHVAICDQVGDEPVKGLMQREVVRVVTPGTVVEPALLDEKRNNYLAAIVLGEGAAGLAYADITTGEFASTQLEGDDAPVRLAQELARLDPRECLLSESQAEQGFPVQTPDDLHVTSVADWRWDVGHAAQSLQDHFQTASLGAFGLGEQPLAVSAAGALLQYLQDTQRGALEQLTPLSTYTTGDFMLLDAATRRNLELTETIRGRTVQGSLLSVLDRTTTAMGGRALRRWVSQPLLDRARLERRLDAVQSLYDDAHTRAHVMEMFRQVADLERLANRVVTGRAGPRELVSLRETLELVPSLLGLLGSMPGLDQVAERLDPLEPVVTLIASAIAEDPPATLNTVGVIRRGFSVELDEITDRSQHARDWIANLEPVERERTGIKNLKVGYNKVFGYYIEVTKANSDHVPDDFVRKQTLVNAERYITPEMKEYEVLVLNAGEEINTLERQLFKEVCRDIASYNDALLRTARGLAWLDVFAGLAEVAAREGFVRPILTDDDVLGVTQGRHPVVEQLLAEQRFVPNDTHFAEGERIQIITGPNMSGKSTILRQVALIVLLAQIGSFVPADAATVGIVDRIFTRIGAQDEIHAGQSTFMVEMLETANILHHATRRSLVILDEIGRGTSTYDGLAIARAVVEFLHNHPRLSPKTLFATHYHELTEMANILPGVANYSVSVAEQGADIAFLYRLVPGGADRSYGIHVARLAGMPPSVVERADDILRELEAQDNIWRPGSKEEQEAYARQMALFNTGPHPLLEALKGLDIEGMTPLEAITKLYELKRWAGEDS
jgi:DNA mismatch repair protein MutS